MILDHLNQGAGITALDSLRLYGVLRLAARIEELRKDGHTIITQTVRVGNKEIARYSLVKEDENGSARAQDRDWSSVEQPGQEVSKQP
jgi:hypothetical protein